MFFLGFPNSNERRYFVAAICFKLLSHCSIGVDKYIETQLDICQATSCFLLKDCPVPLNALSPALKAISHYHNLTKLVLTGINLQDQGFKVSIF